jgi:FemAB-related protein (PEP-CTERM system-associated)
VRPVLDRATGVSLSLAADTERPDWDRFIATHDGATGYHDWEWGGVFKRCFGHQPEYLVARRAGAIAGVLPLVEMRSVLFGRLMSSLPFVNYGGVVSDTPGTAAALVSAATQLARDRGARHLELRHTSRQLADAPCRQHKVSMHLPLTAGMWERFDRKVRNQIRKAEKSGLVAERGGLERLDDFYPVFARNMRDLGTPVYARRFFDEILRTFPTRAHVLVVRLNGEPVAAGVTFRSRDTLEVPWASSLREHNALCPNHLLYWTAIQTALADGCRVLDFGRSTPNEGTYHFKRQWGAVPVPLYWEYPWLDRGAIPDQGPTNPKFKAAIALWKRCPLWLTNVVGPRIGRAIP